MTFDVILPWRWRVTRYRNESAMSAAKSEVRRVVQFVRGHLVQSVVVLLVLFAGGATGLMANSPASNSSIASCGYGYGPCPPPATDGYWTDASDGGIFSFGNAAFFGSMGGSHLNQPVVGMASTPDGRGYWPVASDGGIFSFGDAHFFGSMGSSHLNMPMVGMAEDPLTGGYWTVASDGGIFSFNAPFQGSMGGSHLNKPMVGMAGDANTGGYWTVASDGGIFSFNACLLYTSPSPRD